LVAAVGEAAVAEVVALEAAAEDREVAAAPEVAAAVHEPVAEDPAALGPRWEMSVAAADEVRPIVAEIGGLNPGRTLLARMPIARR
jgi:hypothetical protein